MACGCRCGGGDARSCCAQKKSTNHSGYSCARLAGNDIRRYKSEFGSRRPQQRVARAGTRQQTTQGTLPYKYSTSLTTAAHSPHRCTFSPARRSFQDRSDACFQPAGPSRRAGPICINYGSLQEHRAAQRWAPQRGQPKTTRWRAPNKRPGESGEQECAWSDQEGPLRTAPESCTTPLSAGPEAG